MNNKFRILFWGFILVLVLAFAIFGVSYNKIIYENKKSMLEEIVTTFNNSETVSKYKEYNINMKGTLENKTIVIKVTGTSDYTYNFKFKNTYLELTTNKEDIYKESIAKEILNSIYVYNENDSKPDLNNKEVTITNTKNNVTYKISLK